MKTRYQISYFIALLAASLLCLNAALAAPPTKVMVTSADPNNAEQGEELDVDVFGSGFDQGSSVKYLVTGTKDDTQIDILNVEFISPGQLKTRVKVKGNAFVIDYDIEVRTSGGRRGKGTTLFKVKQVGGGSANPTFDVAIYGDMAGSGTDWQQPNSSAKNINYFFHDHPHIGTGEIDLSYFQDDSGPFAPGRGEKCFGTDLSTQLMFGDILQHQGGAIATLQFIGTTEDELVTLGYHLKLEGLFADPNDWTPQSVNTVILTSWKLKISKKLRRNFSNISCVGKGTFETATFIDVVRTP